ncbi:MAG: MATE family efflux transporter [Roseburia sp.]
MKENQTFFQNVCSLAIPVALQSMLQASFGMIDQIMIGQLGSVSVAGVGLAGKFSSIYTVVVSAIGAVAGIMISQYMGQKNKPEVRRSFYMNLLFACGLAGIFTVLCVLFPKAIMHLYMKDEVTVQAAAGYLTITAATFFPVALATLLSTLLRCMEKAVFPLVASFIATLANTGFNYVLIFGKFGVAPMGVTGAAIATVISQILNMTIMLFFLWKYRNQFKTSGEEEEKIGHFDWKQYSSMLLPILICEFMWSLGENIYAAIYGHLGTNACAAMTLTNPIQGLMIGALCGLSQAAGIIIGKLLGKEKYDEAYRASKKLSLYGFVGSICLSVVLLLIAKYYVEIYQVEEVVKILTIKILVAYALVAPFKVQNMIVGGGILRSGGQTKVVMMIDLIGTWIFGVPLGLISAFVLDLSIPYVYFILSLEECVRFAISIVVFRKRGWMQKLK